MMETGYGADGKAAALLITTMVKLTRVNYDCSALEANTALSLILFSKLPKTATLNHTCVHDHSSIACPDLAQKDGVGVNGQLACNRLNLLAWVQVSG